MEQLRNDYKNEKSYFLMTFSLSTSSSWLKLPTGAKYCRTIISLNLVRPIDHFTVSCLVAWPLNESEAGGDLVLIETSLLFSC